MQEKRQPDCFAWCYYLAGGFKGQIGIQNKSPLLLAIKVDLVVHNSAYRTSLERSDPLLFGARQINPSC